MMKICKTSPLKNTIVTIGNFDGVHLGHQAILKTLSAEAKKQKLQSVVILFEPHPKEFFLGETAPRRLQSFRDKILEIKKCDIDYLFCFPFSQHLSRMEADDFIQDILKKQLDAKILVLGEDFHFGKNRKGDASLLKAAGFKLIALNEKKINHQRVSSTLIRQHLEKDDLKQAEMFLGHPYVVSGHVIHGNKHGRLLGYPTLNIPLHRNIAIHGIYAVTVRLKNKNYKGVANVGRRPALNPIPHPLLEVYVFDYKGACYGEMAEVHFIKKIRNEKNFSSIEALKNQIQNDVLEAQTLLKDH